MTDNTQSRRKIEKLESLASFLDSKYKTPFGFSIGWDGIIGLIPGIGSVITTALSAIIVFHGIQLGASAFVVIRMILNIIADNLIGAVPILGWFADFFWKSNLKNVCLLQTYLASPESTNRSSRFLIGGIVGVAFIFIAALILIAGFLPYLTITYLYGLINGQFN